MLYLYLLINNNMNREEMEKMFDEKFTWDNLYEVKQFIFNTIIPKILNKMLVYEWNWINPIIEKRRYANKIIKQKAKEFYWITL